MHLTQEEIYEFFAGTRFIGHSVAGVLVQNWLINAACSIPADDASTVPWVGIIDDQTIEFELDIKKAAQELIYKSRVYGIGIAIPIIAGVPDDYYSLPFDAKGVPEGGYRGMRTIDPTYINPIGDQDTANPLSPSFMNPSNWQLLSKRIHSSHLIIVKNGNVPQALAPSYNYGGFPVTQLIMTAVYMAQKSSIEMDAILHNMRSTLISVNPEEITYNYRSLIARLARYAGIRDNHGYQAVPHGESISQLTTPLNGMAEISDNQYALVAACARIPVDKLLMKKEGGALSGDSGESTDKIYGQTINMILSALEPLYRRHIILEKASNGEYLQSKDIKISFDQKTLLTPVEKADIELKNAQTIGEYISLGVLNPEFATATAETFVAKLDGE